MNFRLVLIALVICFVQHSVSVAAPNEQSRTAKRITKARVDAFRTLIDGLDSLTADESFDLCSEAFRISGTIKLSDLMAVPSAAKILSDKTIFDASMYTAVPERPNVQSGEAIYLLKLPKWADRDFGIYLYVKQDRRRFPDLSAASQDILTRAIVSHGQR